MATTMQGLNESERRLVNAAARERMKLKLLADIRADLIICELEGWDKTEYIRDIKQMVNDFKV